MDSVFLGLSGLAVMLALVAIRIPIAFCMALVGFVGMYLAVGWPEGGEFDSQRGLDAAWAYTSFEPYSFIANFPIVAVPLFLLMGYVAFHAGFTRDIYYTARVWLSRLHGGLGRRGARGRVRRGSRLRHHRDQRHRPLRLLHARLGRLRDRRIWDLLRRVCLPRWFGNGSCASCAMSPRP